MCGILFILSSNEKKIQTLFELVIPQIENRGPDASHQYALQLNEVTTMVCYGTVLQLRGELMKQPVVDEHGNFLLWNGEIFGGLQIVEGQNDTIAVMEKLNKLTSHAEFVNFFTSIHGPWSFVYFDTKNKELWYGRDFFGRRSLISSCGDDMFSLSSTFHRGLHTDCKEVPAKKLYCLSLKDFQFNNMGEHIREYAFEPAFINKQIARHDHRCLTPVSAGDTEADYVTDTHCTLCGCNSTAGYYRDSANSRVGYCTDNTQRTGLYPNGDNIDQTQYCCSCLHSPSSEGNKKPLSEAKPIVGCTEERKTLVEIRNKLIVVLEESVRTRVFNLPRSSEDTNPNVGVLFSGGIDSVILAALAHRCVPKQEAIDLINVAFQQKNKIQQNVKKKYQKALVEESDNFDVPDRITGRRALLELPRDRCWNFIEVNVTKEELQKEREQSISNLVYPLESVLDDSIGCAIWFAARGIGNRFEISASGDLKLVEENYKTPVKVLLTGMGADEQLGGYARHRTKYENNGWIGLRDEMKMELERISSRNLGRDDRCISDHGREARFPFLDEHVVSFLQSLPVCIKCDPRLPRGEGEKILLREAASLLHLPYASKLPKRAIQFGSRIAKLEGSKEKGNDSCERLKPVPTL